MPHALTNSPSLWLLPTGRTSELWWRLYPLLVGCPNMSSRGGKGCIPNINHESKETKCLPGINGTVLRQYFNIFLSLVVSFFLSLLLIFLFPSLWSIHMWLPKEGCTWFLGCKRKTYNSRCNGNGEEDWMHGFENRT